MPKPTVREIEEKLATYYFRDAYDHPLGSCIDYQNLLTLLSEKYARVEKLDALEKRVSLVEAEQVVQTDTRQFFSLATPAPDAPCSCRQQTGDDAGCKVHGKKCENCGLWPECEKLGYPLDDMSSWTPKQPTCKTCFNPVHDIRQHICGATGCEYGSKYVPAPEKPCATCESVTCGACCDDGRAADKSPAPTEEQAWIPIRIVGSVNINSDKVQYRRSAGDTPQFIFVHPNDIMRAEDKTAERLEEAIALLKTIRPLFRVDTPLGERINSLPVNKKAAEA